MLEVGSEVMVRDGYIEYPWQVPVATIVDVRKDPVLFRTQYRLRFPCGRDAWFDSWMLKTE